MRQGMQDWPLFYQTDTSTQTLKVRSYRPVHLVGRKECDTNVYYFMTLTFLFNHVSKINCPRSHLSNGVGGAKCFFWGGGGGGEGKMVASFIISSWFCAY